MTSVAHLAEATRYAQEYERLRSQVSGASPELQFGPATPPVRGIGLALLLRDGLPAWIRAVRQVLSQAAASAAGKDGAAPSRPPQASPAIPLPEADGDGSGVSTSSCPLVEAARQRDLTTLLASLVLSARRTAHPAAMKEHSPCY
ncbi:MAG TPA: hypothetical protein PKB14_25190 [Rubrivivax sp.]|nr:hypothetical protein [Rubrivivax sp.]